MTQSAQPLVIEWVELSLRVDATLTVGEYGGQPSEWMKPGAEGKVHMLGAPNPEQVKAVYSYLLNDVIGPSVADTIAHLQDKAIEARRGQ